MARICLLTTGGTIASVPAQDGRSVAGGMDGAALAARLQLPAGIELQHESLLHKASSAISEADWLLLARRCQALIAAGSCDGIVITHGTDTLEESAYFLDCVLDTREVAVVLTGSQRVPQAIGSDAERNLGDAVIAAASPDCRGLGVVVAFNQTLFAARFVRKVSSFRVDGFDAPLWGALGLIDSTQPATAPRLALMQRPRPLPLLSLPPALPRVDVFSVHADVRAELLAAVLASGAAGVVLDALGRGHVPPALMAPLRAALAAGRVVAVCSSTLHGGTAQSYEFEGSLHALESAGAMAVPHLSARKARVRLALLLGAGLSAAAVRSELAAALTPALR